MRQLKSEVAMNALEVPLFNEEHFLFDILGIGCVVHNNGL
jgi:hypothetical protein